MTSVGADDQPHLIYEKRDHLAYLTLNRPETRNAISPRMMVELAEAWSDFRDDDTLRVAVLTGAGDAAFCAGADLATLLPLLTGARPPKDHWDERLIEDASVYHTALLRDVPLHKPIVAAVNGLALGGGCELLIASDLRVVSQASSIGLTEVRWGFIPGGGALTRLPRQIGLTYAAEMILTGQSVTASDAERMGLVNRVVEPEAVMPVAEALAAAIARNAPHAVRAAKEALFATSGHTLSRAYEIEDSCARRVGDSQEAREGMRSFLERREPEFT